MDHKMPMHKELAMGIESKKELPTPRKAKFKEGGSMKMKCGGSAKKGGKK